MQRDLQQFTNQDAYKQRKPFEGARTRPVVSLKMALHKAAFKRSVQKLVRELTWEFLKMNEIDCVR